MEATNLAELDDAMRHRMEMYALLARLYREEVDGDLLQMLQEGGVTVSGDASLDEGLYLMRRYLASSDASTLDLAKDYAKVFCGAASTNKTAAAGAFFVAPTTLAASTRASTRRRFSKSSSPCSSAASNIVSTSSSDNP